MEKFEFKNNADYKNFVKYLYSQAKEESIEDKERHRKIMNSKKELIGLNMSQLRGIAKEITKSNYLNFLKISNDDIFEVSMIRGLVIVSIKDYNLQIEMLNNWLKNIDSWGLCDSVVSTMKWLKKTDNKEKYFDYFYNLCFKKEEYISRFGIVVMMAYYIEDKYLDKIFEMCNVVNEDKYYIQMAIAWLISYLYIKFPEQTYKFLQNNTLLPFTQNKSIQKCRESFRVSKEDKEKLNKLKIK